MRDEWLADIHTGQTRLKKGCRRLTRETATARQIESGLDRLVFAIHIKWSHSRKSLKTCSPHIPYARVRTNCRTTSRGITHYVPQSLRLVAAEATLGYGCSQEYALVAVGTPLRAVFSYMGER